MKILIACEESQRVCIEFRRKGHEAYSCDITDCSGGHPEWHIQENVIPLLNGNCTFKTVDGIEHSISGKWDMIIAFPPCTYLTNAGVPCHSLKNHSPEYVINRWRCRAEAVAFFFMIWGADCKKICIENPVGFINHIIAPAQTIHPYMFAASSQDEDYRFKRTCLWLKGLTPLKRTNDFPISQYEKYIDHNGKEKSKSWTLSFGSGHSKERSKTAESIARAMADQWG